MTKFVVWEIRHYEVEAEDQEEAELTLERARDEFRDNDYFCDNWEQWYLAGTEPVPGPYHVKGLERNENANNG